MAVAAAIALPLSIAPTRADPPAAAPTQGSPALPDARPRLAVEVEAALEALPPLGDHAETGRRGSLRWTVAVGSGTFRPRDDREREWPEPIRRVRAVQEAVVNARAAAAELLELRIETIADTEQSGKDPTARMEVVARLQRTTLCAMRTWRATVEQQGEVTTARVLLYATLDTEPPKATEGMPCFPDAASAAAAILDWACQGLCTDGAVRVLVGPPDSARLRTFGVGMGLNDRKGARVAEQLARAALALDRPVEVSGTTALARRGRAADPLSPEGNAALLEKRFFRERAIHGSAIVTLEGRVLRAQPDGVTYCVAWGAATAADGP